MMPAALALTVLIPVFIACSWMALRAQARQVPSLEAWNLAAAVFATVVAVVFIFLGARLGGIPLGVVAALRWWLWWHGRGGRKRKRPLRALGHKARARLAAMARNMPKPGPLLRPVPQAVRA